MSDSEAQKRKRVRVMIVDDSGSFRTVVKLALQKAGYGVVEAGDGKDAAAAIHKHLAAKAAPAAAAAE
jgi:CheY-like chemotaxis protein